MSELLFGEQHTDKLDVDNGCVKREHYDGYMTQVLLSEFSLQYNDKAKRRCSGWSNHKRFVVEAEARRGYRRWKFLSSRICIM